MSFSKARLRRFNEEISQVPSPGRYDPKTDVNVKGAVMPTSRRFPGQFTSSSSLDNIEKASTASQGVVFRTPQLVRKVPLTPRVQHLRDKNFDTSGSDILSSEERSCVKSTLKKTVSKADYKRLEEEFHSLTNEYHKMILDKEMEVNILKEEIEEIKIHEAELKDILEEKNQLAIDRHEETLQLKDNLETMVEKINADREEHQKFINDLKTEISELKNKKYELETVLAEKQSVIVTINDKYSDLENELKSLQEENMILEQANSCILIGAEEKLQQLERELVSKLQSFSETLDGQYKEKQIAFQSKMNFVIHEFNFKSKEIIEQVKKSQEKVKGLEKLIDKKAKEFSGDIKEADERCKYLYRELCKVEEQRDELLVTDLEKKMTIIGLQEKSDVCQTELEECRNTCRKYQITLNTMNETITALSSRLLESEQEVERLNGVENDLESQKLLLEEKSQVLLADIVALRESMDKMEEEIIRDVSALKEYLEAKTEIFKKEAIKTEQALKHKISEKQCAIDILLKENEYFKTEVERKDEFVKEMRKKENNYEGNISKLKSECSKLEEEMSEKLSAQKNLYKILQNKLESTNSLISDLQHLKSQHESQISSLVGQLEEFKSASTSLKRVNTEQAVVIESLQNEQAMNRDLEAKQKQYIDELISDLVLEKERCKAVEAEKDRIKTLLNDTELIVIEKTEETKKLMSSMKSLQLSLQNSEKKLSVLEDEKSMIEQQLSEAETNMDKLKALDCTAQMELQQKISDLQCQLSSAKEKIKMEIPKLERDNINKAENILELNLNIDSMKDEMELLKTKISCLETEKNSLHNVIEESKSKMCDYEQKLQYKQLKINVLEEEVNTKDALCQDLLSQHDTLSSAYNKQNEEMKQNAEQTMELLAAEDKISDLETKLSEKEIEVERLSLRIKEMEVKLHLDEVHTLREKLEDLQTKYEVAIEEKDKLAQEVGDLMGHQNHHQKIKKVNELKQYTVELQNEKELLSLESVKWKTKYETLKKKIEDKENVSMLQRGEDKQKGSKPMKKKQMSPAVLKSSNH